MRACAMRGKDHGVQKHRFVVKTWSTGQCPRGTVCAYRSSCEAVAAEACVCVCIVRGGEQWHSEIPSVYGANSIHPNHPTPLNSAQLKLPPNALPPKRSRLSAYAGKRRAKRRRSRLAARATPARTQLRGAANALRICSVCARAVAPRAPPSPAAERRQLGGKAPCAPV